MANDNTLERRFPGRRPPGQGPQRARGHVRPVLRSAARHSSRDAQSPCPSTANGLTEGSGPMGTITIDGVDGSSFPVAFNAQVERPPVISGANASSFCSSTFAEISGSTKVSDESGVSVSFSASGPGGQSTNTGMSQEAGAWFGTVDFSSPAPTLTTHPSSTAPGRGRCRPPILVATQLTPAAPPPSPAEGRYIHPGSTSPPRPRVVTPIRDGCNDLAMVKLQRDHEERAREGARTRRRAYGASFLWQLRYEGFGLNRTHSGQRAPPRSPGGARSPT
jgi:hypothetical protein